MIEKKETWKEAERQLRYDEVMMMPKSEMHELRVREERRCARKEAKSRQQRQRQSHEACRRGRAREQRGQEMSAQSHKR